MTATPVIGFIGFGEAGSHIAKGLKAAGIEKIFAFDIQADSGEAGQLIRRRATESNTTLVDSPSELAAAAHILFSTVTADSALNAARQTIAFIRNDHIYADLNSVSPALKQEVDSIIRAGGGRFVEAAVMAPVPPYAHRVPMLLGGEGAGTFASLLRPFGMQLEIVEGKVGTAVAVKMCRSVVVKGLEALLFECVLGASRYGAEDRVFASLNETFPGMDWKKLADYMIGRVVLHGERRSHEMEEVAGTLRAAGVTPVMAEATAQRQAWGAKLGLQSAFGSSGPSTYREVLDRIGPRDTIL